MSDTSSLPARFSAFLEESVDGFNELKSITQLTAGASKQTFKVDVVTDKGNKSYAYRCNGPEDSGQEKVAQITLTTEARLLQLAREHEVPVPEVLAVRTPDRAEQLGLDDGFLMEWLEGETLGHRIVRAERYCNIRGTLAQQCGEILGRIHSIDWQQNTLADLLPCVTTEQLIDETWSQYEAHGVPKPMIDYTLRWLKDNIPETSRLGLVHGDFRNGNLMVTERGINAVLDWELAHIGDPVRDLGWLCVNSWRFGFAEKEVGGFGQVDDLLDSYQEITGIRVSRTELKFWQVFGSFWWSCTTLLMAGSWRSGANKSLERPAIGRRSSEAQMDCVNLIMPGTVILDLQENTDVRADQLPSGSELLTSVSDFLSTELKGKLDAHDSFMAKVAANSLTIVKREIVYGKQFEQHEHRSLKNILASDGSLTELRSKLSEELRRGMPLETPGLQEHLRNSVARQLYIDQPNYSALAAVVPNN